VARLAALRSYVRYAPVGAGKPVVARRLLTALRSLPRTTTVRTRPGLRLHTATDDLLQAYLYLFGVWEPNITAYVARVLRPGDTFVDVGANIGYFTVLAARVLRGRGRVVAVEASTEFAEALRANVALNRCPDVRVVNVAAADRPGVLEFFQPCRFNRGNTTSVQPAPAPRPLFTVAARPLPDLLTREELRSARLVKIDVEGAEDAVLRGLLPAVPDMRDDVELIVEVNPALLALQSGSAAALFESLARRGFHAYRIANRYCVPDYVSRAAPSPPMRCEQPADELSDYVFSRRDTFSL
jgi:FkbM family methyltransferase